MLNVALVQGEQTAYFVLTGDIDWRLDIDDGASLALSDGTMIEAYWSGDDRGWRMDIPYLGHKFVVHIAGKDNDRVEFAAPIMWAVQSDIVLVPTR